MTQQFLPLEFIKSDMERLDNPKYFMKNFQCQQLIKFFSDIRSLQQINQKRDQINLFYDRYINIIVTNKDIYVQLKWTIIMHRIIQKFRQKTPLFGFTLKALQLNLEQMIKYQKITGQYEKYLIFKLVKPYIQYLCKLCILNIPDQIYKYDVRSAEEIQIPQTQTQDQRQNDQNKEIQQINMKLVQWYRKYNFVSQTLNTFEPVLKEVHNFFAYSFPFLNCINETITYDLNNHIFMLKYKFKTLKKSNVSLIELDELESRMKKFKNQQKQLFEATFQNGQKFQDISKDELKQFMQSPLKPFQLKLFAKKSINSPIPPIN